MLISLFMLVVLISLVIHLVVDHDTDAHAYLGGSRDLCFFPCRADLHGALVKVTQASCPSHRGVEGLVVLETKNTLQILGNNSLLLGSSSSAPCR